MGHAHKKYVNRKRNNVLKFHREFKWKFMKNIREMEKVFAQIPYELIEIIVSFLDPRKKLQISMVCKFWNEIVNQKRCWMEFIFSKFRDFKFEKGNFNNVLKVRKVLLENEKKGESKTKEEKEEVEGLEELAFLQKICFDIISFPSYLDSSVEFPQHPQYNGRKITHKMSEFYKIEGENVTYHVDEENDSERVNIRSNKPIPMEFHQTFLYFEVELVDSVATSLGIVNSKYVVNTQIGWRDYSIGYHSDDGGLFLCEGYHRRKFEKYKSGDTVGFGMTNPKYGRKIFFTKNGKLAFYACDFDFELLNKDESYYFAVCCWENSKVKVNFGERRYKFDVLEEENLKKFKQMIEMNEGNRIPFSMNSKTLSRGYFETESDDDHDADHDNQNDNSVIGNFERIGRNIDALEELLEKFGEK